MCLFVIAAFGSLEGAQCQMFQSMQLLEDRYRPNTRERSSWYIEGSLGDKMSSRKATPVNARRTQTRLKTASHFGLLWFGMWSPPRKLKMVDLRNSGAVCFHFSLLAPLRALVINPPRRLATLPRRIDVGVIRC